LKIVYFEVFYLTTTQPIEARFKSMLQCSMTCNVPEEELFESNIYNIREMERKAIGIFMTLPESIDYSYEEYTNYFFV